MRMYLVFVGLFVAFLLLSKRGGDQPGSPLSAEQHAEIVRLLALGKRLEAMKFHRHATGSSLRAAKAATEAIAATLSLARDA